MPKGFALRSVVPVLLTAATLCVSAQAAVLEFESTRRTVTAFGSGPETFTQQAFPGVPSLTNVSVFGDGRYRSTGDTFDGVTDSLNGGYVVAFFRDRGDGVGLYAGFSGLIDPMDGWQGGTGNYEGATGLAAFAGYSRTSALSITHTVSDFGYTSAPAITTPSYVLADISAPGQSSPDTSDLTDTVMGYRDVSFSFRMRPYSFSPEGVITAVPDDGPGPFTSLRHVFGDGNVAAFEWTGPDGAFVRGEMTFLASPVVPNTVPVPDEFGADERSLLSGFYRITEGRTGDLRVTGGYVAFSGLSTVDATSGFDSGTGLVSLSAYGWIATQPIPEPETWVMLGLGGLLLMSRRPRQSRGTQSYP